LKLEVAGECYLDPCNYSLISLAGAISRICLPPWISPT